MERDLSAEIAEGTSAGVVGGDISVEVGRDGEARGMMSRGSGGAEYTGY
jgi:hypothetical protein